MAHTAIFETRWEGPSQKKLSTKCQDRCIVLLFFHCFTPLCQVAVKAAESHDTSYKDQATWHVCASCDNGVRSQLLCLHTNTQQKSILSYKKRWSGCTETVAWLWTFWDSYIPSITDYHSIFLQTPRNLLQPMPSIDALRCQLQVNQHC